MKRSWNIFERDVCAAISFAFLFSLPPASAQQAPEEVYVIGKGITAPELLPMNFSTLGQDACESKPSGKVRLSMIVDSAGHPRNIIFTKPLANDVDRLALVVVEADRFKPAMRDNTPVAVGQSVEVDLKACVLPQNNGAGQGKLSLHLREEPVQKFRNDEDLQGEIRLAPDEDSPKKLDNGVAKHSNVGGKISAPVLLASPLAGYTEQARQSRLSGICLIQVIVDRHGLPRDARVVRPLGSGLDQSALIAVSRYRFKPAMKEGEPVPFMITIEVNFRL